MASTTLKSQSLQTVPYVDIKKYAGKWYEIASYPQRFQKGCHGTTAEYTWSEKGYVIVENRCNKGSLSGKQSYIKGKAFVEENSGNAGPSKANTGLLTWQMIIVMPLSVIPTKTICGFFPEPQK
jgi:lipocalin